MSYQPTTKDYLKVAKETAPSGILALVSIGVGGYITLNYGKDIIGQIGQVPFMIITTIIILLVSSKLTSK